MKRHLWIILLAISSSMYAQKNTPIFDLGPYQEVLVDPINIFREATIGDTIIIENNTTGCFEHFYSKTFLIQKGIGWMIHQHQYRVECGQESKSGKLEISQKPIHISKATFIKNGDIAKINLAVNKISKNTNGSCTTKSIYTIKYQKKSLTLYDGSCEDLLNDILYAYTGFYY